MLTGRLGAWQSTGDGDAFRILRATNEGLALGNCKEDQQKQNTRGPTKDVDLLTLFLGVFMPKILGDF